MDLAFARGRGVVTDQLDVSNSGAPVRVSCMIAVIGIRDSDGSNGYLGGSIYPSDNGALKVFRRATNQGGRDRSTSAHKHFQARQTRPGTACCGQYLLQEGSCTRHVGASFRDDQTYRIIRVPSLHEHCGSTDEQRTLERIDGAADMGNRRGHQEFVTRLY